MAIDDPDELDRVDREIRINELKNEADDLAGGQMEAFTSEDCPPEIAEQFWQQVVDDEKAPWTTHYAQLVEAGVDLPAPEELDDERLSAKLWEVIDGLAKLRVFLSCTDHLSDRELYTHLVEESLREQVKEMPVDPDSAYHIDILGGGSEEDTYLYLKHYADEEWRELWAKDFPEDEIPAHEDPPYDRDRHLPRATYDRPT